MRRVRCAKLYKTFRIKYPYSDLTKSQRRGMRKEYIKYKASLQANL